MLHLVAHGLEVTGRRSRGRVHALLNDVTTLVERGDLALEVLLSGPQHGTATLGVGAGGLEPGHLTFEVRQTRGLRQRVPAVLELTQGGVEVLHDEQALEVLGGVGHPIAS